MAVFILFKYNAKFWYPSEAKRAKRVGFSYLSLICFTCFSTPVSNILFLFFLELHDLTVRIFYHTFSQKMSMIMTQTADETKHRL